MTTADSRRATRADWFGLLKACAAETAVIFVLAAVCFALGGHA